MVLTYDDTLQVYRSPYRLYRPYQFDIQQTTIPSNSTPLYRTPNLNILSEINRRSRRFERIVSYQKILTVTQMFFSLLLMILEVTKILLMWENFNNWEQRFTLVCEIFQPILFATAAFLTLYSVLRPTKNTSQIAIASLVAALVPLFMFPTQSPFVINAIEAIRLSRLINHPSISSDEAQPEILSPSIGMSNLERLQQLTHLPILTLSKHVKAQNWKSIPTFPSVPSSTSSTLTTSFYAIQQLLTLQYLLIAYAFFSFAYYIVLVMTLITYVQLIQLQ